MKLEYSLQIVTMQNIEPKNVELIFQVVQLPRFGGTWQFMDQNEETLDPF